EIGKLLKGQDCEVCPREPAEFTLVSVLPGPTDQEIPAGLEPFLRRLYITEPGNIELYRGGGGVILEMGKWRLELAGVRFSGAVMIRDLPVGRGFPWEFTENAMFHGETEILPWKEGQLRPVNIVSVEDYIASVVASEIGQAAPHEAQKAQAVAARSTLFSTYGSHHLLGPFGICSEDHCQVYRGFGLETPDSRLAATETSGLVLLYEGWVVDARFSKCCGGITEEFRGAWDGLDVPYLVSRPDGKYNLSLNSEEDVKNFINNPPPAFCSGSKNFRWETAYRTDQISQIIRAKTGQDIGAITEITPLARAKSGRINRIRLIGQKRELVLGPELEIRRVLSETYLNSSCFYVMRNGDSFIIRGAGWGHGVGMCQEGAIAMARDGKGFSEILEFYYPWTRTERV
ncbi:MAG: SpoIID/LytB domain-containing protein, partial [Candidatus Hydrothermia bacterium]